VTGGAPPATDAETANAETDAAGTSDLPIDNGLRIDKWLWYARFCKTRSLAARLAAGGRVRCAGTIVTKPHHPVRPGAVLTFPLGRHIRVIRVVALGHRRGPPAEAQSLYEDLEPPTPDNALPAAL
jgi:ribosome-associated heat shock protein Hsp15